MKKSNILCLMYDIGDSLASMMTLYKFMNPLYHKAKRLYDYWYSLMQNQQVELFEWFIGCVLYESVDSAYKNMRAVLEV
jgi:hypothetical protein